MKKSLFCFLVVVGILMALAGLLFMGMYFMYAIVGHVGEPDQSLIFWYLPILFIGVISFGLGSLLAWLGIKVVRAKKT